MIHSLLVWSLLLLPIVAGCLSLLASTPRKTLVVVATGGVIWAVLAVVVAGITLRSGVLSVAENWLRLDMLSAYHLFVLALVAGMSSVYALRYFEHERRQGGLTRSAINKFGALWFGSVAAMVAVLICNNLGLMWVAIEGTTLLTAFLITIHITPLSLEAMWKYIIVCSVGVAFAFIGTLLTAFAASGLTHDGDNILMWSFLRQSAEGLSAEPMKLAFLFAVVGFGTKAGLAPMHSWLPDAHSQAPAPVSALLSGFMLNSALYCIMRYLPLVEHATGNVGWGQEILVVLGLVSMLVAAAFIIFQRDGKRLLAYSSIEHMGVIAIGLGLGGIGSFAALWHVLNHSLCKTLAFFSVGSLGKLYGTHELEAMGGAIRHSAVWGLGFFLGLLVLIGVAPFAIFMSELQILRAAVDARAIVTLILFLSAAGIVFASALRHAIAPAWGGADKPPAQSSAPTTLSDGLLVFGVLGVLLLLGLWLPTPLRTAIESAAAIVGGQP